MTQRPKPRREIFACPHCGADVQVGSKVCRECGSDAATGWLDGESLDYESVEIPDGWSESGTAIEPRRRRWIAWVAIVVALALLVLTVLR
ncbi:MAG: hypothetical protein JNL08_16155 [Planctomycetes bacterium]|nr:hypothetical protein [Planctomycetota bacterium]